MQDIWQKRGALTRVSIHSPHTHTKHTHTTQAHKIATHTHRTRTCTHTRKCTRTRTQTRGCADRDDAPGRPRTQKDVPRRTGTHEVARTNGRSHVCTPTRLPARPPARWPALTHARLHILYFVCFCYHRCGLCVNVTLCKRTLTSALTSSLMTSPGMG